MKRAASVSCMIGIAMFAAACSKAPAPPVAAPAAESPAAPASQPEMPAGATSIADLGGPSWTLQSFDQDDPVPEGVTIMLTVDGGTGSVSGQGGCNRYMGSVSNGDAPGTLKFGPLAMTRMACAPPADQAESRYAAALQNASSFEVAGGTLKIHYADGDRSRTLTYRRG